MNYGSYSPTIYKKPVIKTLIYQAYNLCLTWKTFEQKISQIKLNLINSDHSQYSIENLINKTLKKYFNKENII